MMNTLRNTRKGIGLIVVLTCAVFLGGCKRGEESPKLQSLKGKVEKIEVNADGTGKITIIYFSQKQDQEITGTGLVTKETEILINGAVSSLSDIKEGERVRGEVRIVKNGEARTQVALKIYIDRPKPVGSAG